MVNELSSRFTPIDDSYQTCDRTETTLAIYNINPTLVTKKLGVIPTFSQQKGEPIVFRNGNKGIGTINSWLLSSESEVISRDIRRHLDWLLDKIEPAVAQLRELQQHPDVRMAIRCVWWSADGGGGPTLWPEQMRRMAQLNLECTFSFAYYGDDE